MKPKIFITICFILIFSLSSFGDFAVFASQPENTTQESTSPSETELNPYLINETSSIKSDFYHLGIERIKYKNLEDILRSELISMICLDSSLYVYWAMPEDTDYQVNYIIINDHKYENGMRLLNADGNYRKYVFLDFEEAENEQYQITEVGFQNSEGEDIKYTIKINCKMGNSDNQYFFEQETENNIVLVGMLLESIYQFNNEKGTLRDAWDNFFSDIKAKDGDQRSFYYFAFNCFDREINHYFTPDEITKIVIEYTINQYTFSGNIEDYKEAQLRRKEQKIQVVTPETIRVEAKDERKSNGKPYEYNTIYKLIEADIKADNNDETKREQTANSNTLFTAQQAGFEWVVHFGDTQGYRYAENSKDGLFKDTTVDIDFTKVEEFSTISMSYTYKGKSYSAATDTIVDMEVMTKREQDQTENLTKQISDSISYAAEDLGNMLANTVTAVTSVPFHFLGGILKNTAIRIIFIVLIIIAIPFIIFLAPKLVKLFALKADKVMQEKAKAIQMPNRYLNDNNDDDDSDNNNNFI